MSIVRVLIVGLLLFLTGCPHVPSLTTAGSVASLAGIAQFTETYRTQSSTTEIATAATVSLIDPQNGQTVATTLTTATGAFSLAFQNWTPQNGYPYLLEAVKGLTTGGAPNRVGASAARLRTLVSYSPSGWSSLTSSAITINRSTTALCVIASLKGLSISQQSALIGSITIGPPDTFGTPAAGGILASEYASVYGLVDAAITLNQDPVRAIARDVTTGNYARLEHGPIVSDFSTLSGSVGGSVVLYGNGFDPAAANNKVAFNGTLAASVSVDPTASQLTVQIPTGASTGFVTVQVGNLLTTSGAVFYVTGTTIQTFAGGGFPATGWKFKGLAGIAVDPSGNLYVTDYSGNEVFKIAPTGVLSPFAGTGSAGFLGDGSQAVNARLSGPSYLAADGLGNVYIEDDNNNCVRKVTTDGIIRTVAGRGGGSVTLAPTLGTSVSLASVCGLSADLGGNAYITQMGSNAAIITPDGKIKIYAGGATPPSGNGDGGPATAASLNACESACDPVGNFFIFDMTSNTIRRVDAATHVISNYCPAYSSNDWIGMDGLGNVLISQSSKVVMVASGSLTMTTIAGGGGSVTDGIAPTAASLSPQGVTGDAAGNVYIVDHTHGLVWMLPKTSGTYFGKAMTAGLLYIIAGSSGNVGPGDGGAASAAALTAPDGVAVDAAGNVYIADSTGNRVRMVPKTGGSYFGQTMSANAIYTIAGNGTATFAGDTGPATSASLNDPSGVTVDSLGNVYIADSLNHRVRMVPKTSNTYFGQAMTANDIYTIAGNGSGAFGGDTGLGTSASLWFPSSVAVDSLGNVYILDANNHRVRMVPKTSNTYFGQAMTANDIYTIAGNGNSTFGGDTGLATSASLWYPFGVAVDSLGNVYIADTYNNRVRMVPKTSNTYFGQAMTANDIYTIAGNGSATYGGDNGLGTSAGLNGPRGVVVDGGGNVYIGDYGNNRVRCLAGNGIITTIAGSGIAGFAGDGGGAPSAWLSSPVGLAVGGPGLLYLADEKNNRIRQIY